MVFRKESLIKRIEKLKEYRHDLKEFGEISYNDYLKNKQIRYTIERILFLISENILDFLDHILSSRFEIISDSYEDIVSNAHEQGVITDELYSKLKGLGGFRNVLAHEYMSISNEEVYRNLQKMLSIIDQIIEHFEGTI